MEFLFTYLFYDFLIHKIFTLNSEFNTIILQCTNLLLKARPDSAPFVSAEHVESKLISSVKQHWMELHKYYKQRSEDNHVSTEVFQAGLESVGIVLSVMDLSILCKKYDSKGSHRIAFKEFLRKFTVSGRVSGMSGRMSAASRDSRMVSSVSLVIEPLLEVILKIFQKALHSVYFISAPL